MLLYVQFPEWINPQIVPGLPFQWYGMMYLVAFTITFVLTRRQLRASDMAVSDDDLMNVFFWAIIGLLIGGRLFATLIFNDSWYYWQNPQRIFWPFAPDGTFVGLQGMNFYGGLAGGTLGAVLYARWKRIDVLELGDMIIAAVPLGYTFGRIGNFINGELYGRVTTAPWGVLFPNAERLSLSEPWVARIMTQVGMTPSDAVDGMINLPRHPTQLYEGFTEGILAWLVIWPFLRHRKPYRGFLIAFYILWYGLWRFGIDYLRMPLAGDYILRLAADPTISTHRFVSLWNFTDSQVWSGLMILSGGLLLVVFKRMDQRRILQENQRARSKTRLSRSQRRRLRKN